MIGKWTIGTAALLAGIAATVVGIGLMLPRDHVARVTRSFDAPPDRVAALVRDVDAQPRWRKDVERIDVRERGPGHVRYVERSGHNAIAYDFREEVEGQRFRSTIADPDLPFGGFWIIALTPEGGGTRVEIVEHGSVRNPLFRFFSALIFGHDITAKAYLADLDRALNKNQNN